MAQFARPDADNGIGAWSDNTSGTTNIYQAVDETTASDTDYIKSEDDPGTSVCELSLSDVSDPATSSGHVVRYRYRREDTGGGSTPTINLIVRLREGASTTVASVTHSGIGTSWVDGSFTLSGAEADSIIDYANLYIQFEADKTGGARTSRAEVSWAEFEVPDAETIQAVGRSGETDSAFSTTVDKTLSVIYPTETDSAFSTSTSKTLQVGLSSEADSAFAVAAPKTLNLSQSQETDSAFSTSAGKVITVGQAQETDSSFAIVAPKTVNINQTTETDTALSLVATFLRITQVEVSTVLKENPSLTVTQAFVNYLSDNNPSFKVTQAFVNFLSDNNPPLRNTQLLSQVVTKPDLWRFVPYTDIDNSGSWTTGATALWENIVHDDATYIDSPLSPSSASFEVGIKNLYLGPLTNGYPLILPIRIAKVDSSGVAQQDGDEIDITVELINSSSTIFTWTITDIKADNGLIILRADPSSPLVTPISPGESSLKVTANTSSSGTARKARLYYSNFETRDETPTLCLWFWCNCNNSTGCTPCVGTPSGVEGLTANVNMSGIVDDVCSSCETDFNGTFNISLTEHIPGAGLCQYSGSISDNCNYASFSVFIYFDTGLVRLWAWSGAFSGGPGESGQTKIWDAQMTPLGNGWDCGSLSASDFEVVVNTGASNPNGRVDCAIRDYTLNSFSLT